MGKTIERKFEYNGPFILRDAFVEKGMRQTTFYESRTQGQDITPENVKQFISDYLKDRWTLRHVRYTHKNPYSEKNDIISNLEFNHDQIVKRQEFIELGMPLEIKYKVSKVLEAV